MKHIKLFENFKGVLDSNLEDIRDMLVHYDIENFIVNRDGTVDVNGDVNLGYYKLKRLGYKKLEKIPFKFGKVSGSFMISKNNITSLDGCPYYVGG